MTDIALPTQNRKRGRRPTISPEHGVRRVAAIIPAPVADDLEAEAQRRRVSVSRVIRDRLARPADGIHA